MALSQILAKSFVNYYTPVGVFSEVCLLVVKVCLSLVVQRIFSIRFFSRGSLLAADIAKYQVTEPNQHMRLLPTAERKKGPFSPNCIGEVRMDFSLVPGSPSFRYAWIFPSYQEGPGNCYNFCISFLCFFSFLFINPYRV